MSIFISKTVQMFYQFFHIVQSKTYVGTVLLTSSCSHMTEATKASSLAFLQVSLLITNKCYF